MALLLRKVFLPSVVVLLVGISVTSSSAQEVDCSQLDELSCLVSTECMVSANTENYGYQCSAPLDRCQIGFAQGIIDQTGYFVDAERTSETIVQCESQIGCFFVQGGPCYCPPNLNCFCGGGPPPNCLPMAAESLSPPTGQYAVIDVRRASDVSAPAGEPDQSELIGQTVHFEVDSVSLAGIGCDQWGIREIESPVWLDDPLLSDVLMNSPKGSEEYPDKMLLKGWEYDCEGEVFVDVLQVDNRVLIVPWSNGSQNLVLERPLREGKIRLLQTRLMNHGFDGVQETGQLDDKTLEAISEFAAKRNNAAEQYRFARTAITENLLAQLGIMYYP